MQEFFGEVADGEMKLFEIGKIVNEYWQEIPKHFPFVALDKFVVMPNHIHGIVEICDGMENATSRDAINGVSTGGITGKYNPMNNPRSLSKIIRWYKGRCSFEIGKNTSTIDFQWQSRFYDRVIRDEQSLGKIREYIERNPKFWDEDKNKVENIFY